MEILMRTAPFSSSPLAAAVTLALSACLLPAQADTIIDHANGYTLNAAGQLQRFTSLAFDDLGRIIAVGSERETAAALPKAEHIDVQGKTLLPGLIDAHGHVFELGEIASGVDLYSSTSLNGAVRAVAEFSRSHSKQAWIIGFGWNQEIWKLGRFPTAAELDAVVNDRPVLLHRVDGHASWVNTKALEMAGITRDTQDPAGGKIERDASGRPTGVLVDAAMELVNKVVPLPTPAEARATLDVALASLSKIGLTSVHDAGIKVVQDDLYRDYADHGKLTTRVYAMIGDTTGDFDELSKEGPLKSYANDVYAGSGQAVFGRRAWQPGCGIAGAVHRHAVDQGAAVLSERGNAGQDEQGDEGRLSGQYSRHRRCRQPPAAGRLRAVDPEI
jgi:predicted amidohydrolase YtcJ